MSFSVRQNEATCIPEPDAHDGPAKSSGQVFFKPCPSCSHPIQLPTSGAPLEPVVCGGCGSLVGNPA